MARPCPERRGALRSQAHAQHGQAPTPTYLSSLSSRLTSFFCLRVSSRLRRASASSVTALSRSRLRLSQSVLAEGTGQGHHEGLRGAGLGLQ